MMDPYRVLGISPSASDTEIKKAYRNLSRKYHPDANIDNPNKEAAEEKFKEIQAAYNQIMDERQNGSAFNQRNYYNNNSSNSSYYYSDSPLLRTAASYINNRQFGAAMQVLSTIPDEQRNGKWYFFAAVASQGLGNTFDAQEYISRAIALEPSNLEYRRFYQTINFNNASASSWYFNQGSSYGYERPFFGVAKWCASVALINILCNLLCCL